MQYIGMTSSNVSYSDNLEIILQTNSYLITKISVLYVSILDTWFRLSVKRTLSIKNLICAPDVLVYLAVIFFAQFF